MHKLRRGYTIIELMIVVILIAIIAALAIPQINQAARNNALTDATNETALVLRYARSRAARTLKSHRIYIDASNSAASQIIRVDEGEDDDCRDFPACNVTAPDYGGAQCGLAVLRFDHGFYDRNDVQVSKVQTGFPGKVVPRYNTKSNLCVTPMGQLYNITTNCMPDFPFFPVSLNGPLVFTLDRKGAGVGWQGVRRCVTFPDRGMPRTGFGSACPTST